MDSTVSSKELEALNKLRKNVSDILLEKHDDGFLIRWLRARNGDHKKAEKMLRESFEWRKAFDVDSLLDNYRPSELLKDYLSIRVGDRAKNGCTVSLFPCGRYDVTGFINTCKAIDIQKWIIYCLEKSVAKMEQQGNHGQYVILDLEYFSFQMFMRKPVFDLVRNILMIYDANYPELLYKSILINAPAIVNVAFTLLKPFIAERTANKVSIYGKNGWQEVLLKEVGADKLLQHYGGNKPDDCTDDPDWSCNIFTHKDIPEHFYKKRLLFEEKDVTVVTISMASSLNIELDIHNVGTVIKWEFQTEQNDIGFSIAFKTQNGNEEILPMERVNCHLVPHDGTITCSKIGKYEICFDNTYSFLRSKRLAYKIEKVNEQISNE